MSDLHSCPGDCGAQVPRHQLACKPCWGRLPKPLKDDVNTAYRHRAENRRAHVLALRAAMDWYRRNPSGGAP